MGGARVTTLVTLRKCTLGHKREIKTLKFVSASTKGFKGGLAWIKPSKKDMAVTFSYLVRCWVWLPAVVLWWPVSVSVSLPCRLACFRVVGVASVVPCSPVLCSVVLCCGVVLCCCALLSFCGAVCVCSFVCWVLWCCAALWCCAVGLCCVLSFAVCVSPPLKILKSKIKMFRTTTLYTTRHTHAGRQQDHWRVAV